MIFASVTNKKVTSKFHVPLQMPAFKCTQRSQEAVTQHKKSARQEVPQTKITTSLYISEVNSSLHEFALQKVALQYIWLRCISHTFFFPWWHKEGIWLGLNFASLYPALCCIQLCYFQLWLCISSWWSEGRATNLPGRVFHFVGQKY